MVTFNLISSNAGPIEQCCIAPVSFSSLANGRKAGKKFDWRRGSRETVSVKLGVETSSTEATRSFKT